MVERKVSTSLPEDLIKRVDEAANKNKITRNAFIASPRKDVRFREREPKSSDSPPEATEARLSRTQVS